MNLFDRRSKGQENLLLEKRYIRTVLGEEGRDLLGVQSKKMAAAGFRDNALFASRSIDATDTVLNFGHLARHRFIDMKSRRTLRGTVRKKNYAIHNRLLFGYANNIVRRLSVGFTESTRQIMRGIED